MRISDPSSFFLERPHAIALKGMRRIIVELPPIDDLYLAQVPTLRQTILSHRRTPVPIPILKITSPHTAYQEESGAMIVHD